MDLLASALTIYRTEEGTIEKREECPSSEFVVRMPCYAAFFSVAESSESLRQIYEIAEKEIEGLMAMKGADLPRDLELVLLVAGDQPPDPALVRRIADDRYVCRKFILWPNGRHMNDVLADLPFWPPGDLLSKTPVSVAAGVQETVKGYDTRLIGDLASHSPGAKRVFEKIWEGSYNRTGGPSGSEAATLRRVIPSTRTKLQALDITDFRGIRRLRQEDMPLSGDVVFIYGPNGVGKTSIADAIEWAITGEVSRLQQVPPKGGEIDPIVNVFSDKGEARVICCLSNCEAVSRFRRGGLMERLIGSQSADDRAVIDHVVGTKAPSREARLRIERLRDLFRGSHMLSQHDIRQFLERTGPVERFDILTNMIGAEEFVRFREKVAVVSRRLRSHVGAMAEQSKSMKRELEDVSKRLRERKKDLEKLSHAITSGKTPEELASELLKGISICQCTLDEAAVEKANAEPTGRLELLAAHAETAIRSKKAATEDLLVRLESLEQDLEGYIKSRTRCESLAAEIADKKNISEKARADLKNQEKVRQDIKESLQGLRIKQREAEKSYADLTWLKENLPTYRDCQETLRATEDSLAGQRGEIQKSEATLEELRKSLSIKRARLQEVEQTIATKAGTEEALVALLKRLPQVQGNRQVAEQLGEKERQHESRIGELQRQASSARNEVNVGRARLDELQRTYNFEAARHDELSSFLAKLAELVQSAECPLCGRHFPSNEEAKNIIREHLSTIPLQLRNLAHHLDQAKKDTEAKQAHVDSIAAGIRNLEAELKEVRSSKAIALKTVQDFRSECAALAVTVLVDNTASWENILKQALKKCEVAPLRSEATSLRDAISVLARRVVEQQSAVDGFRQKLSHDQNERSRLITSVQAFETAMLQRGFELGSLSHGDRLDTELSEAKETARDLSESAAKRDVELRTVESAIMGLRESLKRADEDVASKEAQLRQYETTCSRFVAACRAINVAPENPKESISIAVQKASELNQLLSSLEEKCRILQQMAGLEKLKREIEDLARAEDNVKRRVETDLCEESRLREWVSHIEGLEASVVKQQIDVVSTHLKHLEPTTQQLYNRLNPHPIFGKIRIRVDEKTRELDVEAEASVACERLCDIAVSPLAFFSNAQINSLAITVFLAGALRQQWSGFNTIVIDDPVQQMDEMNVCAFLDLIRGLSNQRQFIIFTCNRDFYLLALEKLDCLNKSKQGTFRAYRLEGIAPAELKVQCDTP